MSNRTLLVTGASGHLGRRVIELMQNSEDPVISGTRTPDAIPGARLVDFDRPETLDRAFAGVDRLLIISTDTIGVPGKRLTQQRNAVAAAKRAGVKHLVYTSMPNPEGSVVTALAPDHEGTEQAIIDSGITYTILRNNLYFDVFASRFAHWTSTGQLFSAAGAGRVGLVAREDCARIAAAALASKDEGSRTLDVTGPEALSYAEIAAILTKVSGKPVQYIATTPERQTAGLVASGLPAPFAAVFVQFDLATAAGQLATASDAVQKLTGKPPQSLSSFLEANRAALG